MYKKILTGFVGISLFWGLNAGELLNGGFEDGLKEWIVKGKAEIDNKVKAFGKSSLRIDLPESAWQRVFQKIEVEPSAEYEVTYYVKCQNVIAKKGARFAGAASWVSKKKYFPHHGSGGPWKLDQGTQDWKKVSYKFKTGPDDRSIMFQLQLSNASGTIWIDEINIKKIGGGRKKTDIKVSLYPIKFLKQSPFRVAENLTGTIALKVSSAVKSGNAPAELILDVPEFFRITGGTPNLALNPSKTADGKRDPVAYKVVESPKVKRDGKTFRRFRVLFDDNFSRLMSVSWYSHFIFLQAEKNNVGETGPFYWQLRVGNEFSETGEGTLEVMKPVIHRADPCRKFNFLLARSPLLTLPGATGRAEMNTFWKQLADNRYSWIRAVDHPLPGWHPIIAIGGGFWNVIPALQKPLQQLRRELPRNITDQGKPGIGFSNWSKVDDKSGNVEKFYRKGIREIVRIYPEVKNVVWDFEPHPYGFDQGGRARFARAMKLPTVPSIAEINAKYRSQWFSYMVKLHAQYVNKLAKILKAEAPQIKFWLCSDNLYAGPNPISSWCGVDVRLSDQFVDGHMHMPYYTGKRFFDDVQFNIKSLKKPFFPLIDPAETLYSFYSQYTPDKVRQNILAVAALGGIGIGFWPNDAFTADYFQAISNGFSMIAENEDFYFDGKRCEDEFSFIPVNAVVKKLGTVDGNARSLYFPDFPRVLRKTVHRLNGDYLFTVFNYHEYLPMLLKIQGNSHCFFAEIPPNGVKVFRASHPQNQAELKQKVADFQHRMKSEKLPEMKKGNCALEWCAGPQGQPYFKMTDGKTVVWVDLMGDGRIRGLFNAAGNSLLDGGFAAWLMFYDRHQQDILFQIDNMRIENGIPELTLKGVVGPYAGANPTPNPLLGMIVYRKYALDKGTLAVEVSFYNPTGKNMKTGFRLNNYPFPGKRFGAAKVRTALISSGKTRPVNSSFNKFARKGISIPFFDGKKTELWDGGVIALRAEQGALCDEIRFVPDSSFAGLFFWYGVSSHTVELLTPEVTVRPGGRTVFRYRIEMPVKF